MKTSLVCGLLAAVSLCALHFGSPSTAQDAAIQNLALTAKGAWSKSATYAKDDIVTARGSTWRSKVANNKNHLPGSTNPNTAAYWEAFAVGFNPTGAWSSSHTYQPNELATYQGQTWRAKLTSKNAAPVAGTKWDLLVTKGANGATGAKGATGATGATGPQGPAGPNTGVGAGTKAAPSISFAGDPNTGLYSPGADLIALVEGGSYLMHNIGFENTALGFGALQNNTNGGNTAVGHLALSQNGIGGRNTAVGDQAMTASTSSTDNSAFGANALQHMDGGGGNTAIGSSALFSIATGSSNTALGLQALVHSVSGNNNVAVGDSALHASTGNNNTVIGSEALYNATDGSNNIAIGYLAGNNAVSSHVTNSIFIGNDGTSVGNDTVIIGNGSHQKVFMGGISGVTSIDGAAVYINGSGQFGTALSSRRFKQDIEPVTSEAGLLDRLRPVSFRYKQAGTDGSMPLQYGLIAEDVEAVSRDLVIYDKDGKIQTVKYQFLPPLLLAGYQAQQKTIVAQAAELREQKEVNASLEARIRKIEAALSQTKAASLQ